MSIKAIDYKIILRRDGQTQGQRMPQWLNPALVPVDARTKQDFYNYIKAIAKEINFYDLHKINNTIITNGSWEDFFNLENDELTSLAAQASLPPHIALWNAFIELYEKSKQLINTSTGRHLDFYYGDVLRLKKNAAVADKAHIVFELKPNAADTLLKIGTTLLAGKDKAKRDLHYKLTHDIVVNRSKVQQLKALHVNPVNKNFIHHAPIANSSDGLGAELDKVNPKWNAFGNTGLPLAQIGFCLASDVLKMKEGDRKINVTLTINDLPVAALKSALTTNLFKVSVTGEKGWIGPKVVSPVITSADNKIFVATFSFNIAKDEPAVIKYDAALHGNNFNTLHPILQILINNEKADFGYKDLAYAELVDATIEAEAKGLKDLVLENDLGTLDAAKPFAPFGPSPDVNANFSIKNEEAFAKRLKEFSVDVEWKNIPEGDLNNYFSGYGFANNHNGDFTAMASFHDAFNWQGSQVVNLFDTSNAKNAITWRFVNGGGAPKITRKILPEIPVKQNRTAGLTVEQKLATTLGQLVPALAAGKPVTSAPSSNKVVQSSSGKITPFSGPFAQPFIALDQTSVYLYILSLNAPVVQGWINTDNDKRTGKLNLSLKHGFLFKEYRKKFTEDLLAFSKASDKTLSVIKEPFAPEIQSIKFNYIAVTAKTSFSGTSLNDYIDEEIEFFHYGAFGQMREHAYVKSQHLFLNNKTVRLLPEHYNEGEFYIGISGIGAEDSACILIQTIEGSANPDKIKVDLKWSVLCDNYWKDLTNEDFIFDTTNDFLTSGVIKFIIPREATTSNSILPTGLLWLRAAIQQDSDAVCNLTDVQSNAGIVVFDNRDNDASHFAVSLSASTINKLETDVGAIKSLKQPYASFGGQMQENDQAFYTRVSERLRHKERSIALWDYERLILQHFPKVHKVKCINHASVNSYYDPGNVLIIVVPDLTNKNAINPFQPKVDKNTLDEIYTFLKKNCSSWLEAYVSNPFYEPVKISVRIKLKKGFEFNFYEKIVDRQLQEFLSPWITNSGSDIYFGGKITASIIVKFLEGLEFVDFITDLQLFHSTDNGKIFKSSVTVAEASSPASILVSYDHHEIFNY